VITNLSKEIIYKLFSQESIFEAYGCPITNKLFISPLRKDNNPTCKLAYQGSTLLYFDNRPGEFRGDAVGYVMRVKNLSYKEALYDIYNTLKLNNTYTFEKKNKEVISKTSKEIRYIRREFTSEDLKYWESYYITKELLQKYNIVSLEKVFVQNNTGEFFNCKKKEELCFGYLFPDNSIKVYFPERKEYRFIGNSNYLQGYNYVSNEKPLVITKSYKDVIALSLINIQAVAIQSESILPPKEIIDTFECIYLGDSDIPGISACKNIRMQYNIPILLIPKKFKSKDFSDLLKNHSLEVAKKLVEDAKNYLYLKKFNINNEAEKP
jgi:hypothetical protein